MQNKLALNTFPESDFYSSFIRLLGSYQSTIKILMVGDVVGRPGRSVLKHVLPILKQSAQIDFITANGENLAGGFGITEKVFVEIKNAGVDVVTMGNHWKDKHDVFDLRKKFKELVLPQNLSHPLVTSEIPEFFISHRQKTISVLNLMGTFAMRDQYKNPFTVLSERKDDLAEKVRSRGVIAIADIHAEASSEKQAIAWAYDGILAALVGTHTHTPTSDERLTDSGTAFITDVGMTGAYDSVIGMKKERVLQKLSDPSLKILHEVAEKDLWFCGFLVEVCPQKNLSVACHRLQCRGVLGHEEPQWLVSSLYQKRHKRVGYKNLLAISTHS